MDPFNCANRTFHGHDRPPPGIIIGEWSPCSNHMDFCAALTNMFVNVCLNMTDSGASFECNNIRHAYEKRCVKDNAEALSESSSILCMYFIAMLLCVIVGNWVSHHEWIPESGAWIVVGALVGLVCKYTSISTDSSDFMFQPSIFFLLLLPPIIFNAGMEIDKRLFRENIHSILGFAVVGTLIATGVCGMVTYWLCDASDGESFTLVESLIFGALISSIDPVAVLGVFNSVGVDPLVYILVFGESMLNDAVVLVAYDSLESFIDHTGVSVGGAFEIVGKFVYVAVASTAIGLGFGILSSLLFRWQKFENDKMEVLVFYVVALGAYFLCEALSLSGIAALVFESLVMDVFTLRNMSCAARANVRFTIRCIAFLCEMCIFAYLGLAITFGNEQFIWCPWMICVTVFGVLCSRVFSVYPIAFVANLLRASPIPMRAQHMLWFSGLRGAVSLALVVNIPRYNVVLDSGSNHTRELLTCVVVVILLEVFVFGTLCPFALRMLRIPVRSQITRKDLVSAINEELMSDRGPEFLGLGFLLPYLVRPDRISTFPRGAFANRNNRMLHNQLGQPALASATKIAQAQTVDLLGPSSTSAASSSGSPTVVARETAPHPPQQHRVRIASIGKHTSFNPHKKPKKAAYSTFAADDLAIPKKTYNPLG